MHDKVLTQTSDTQAESQVQSSLPPLRQLINHPKIRILLRALVMLVIFWACLSLVQFATPDLPDNDGYYHIKLADLMRTEGLKPAFPYLPLSVLNSREFTDHHFLFHVFLIPFTYGDLRLGAKAAAVFFAGLAFLSIWWLLNRQKVPLAGLWALGLLAVSEAFIFRMSITRAQSLSLAVLVIGLGLLLEKRYKLLLPLSFFFVWFYNAFPLMLALVGSYVLAVALLERRLEWRPVLYSGLGLALGILINPYFPHNIVFMVRHYLPKLTETTAISVGSEWYPYDTGQLLDNSLLALLAFVSAILALGLSGRRMDLRTTVSLFLALVFGLMLFQSRRFIEYFPPFALIFAAFAWTPLIEEWQRRQTMPDHSPAGWLQRSAVGLLLVLILIPGIWLTGRASRASLRSAKPYELFEGASAWLRANTPPGARVFQTDWDDFPRLFYYNTHNTYLIGLDPTYMQLYNDRLYDDWVRITRGQVEQPSSEILERFGARYVISDLKHTDFLRQAAADPGLKEVYRDRLSVVFAIR